MADPAFDAFSQRRNTGTKDRVTERRRVDTYTDPNRYQMPPRRRLGVHAQNKSMFVTPEKENITAFAEGLAEVQPQIMDYLTSKQAAENQKQIEYGIQEAMGVAAAEAGDKEFVDSEWRQFGYEQYRAQEFALSLGTQLKNATASKDPDEPWDSFYNNWWQSVNEEHPELKTMNPEHLETFNKSIAKSIEVSKAANLVKTHKVQQQRYKEQTQETIKNQMKDYAKKGVFNLDAWEAIKNDNQYMSHWSNEDMNEFLFEGVKQLVHEKHFSGRGLKTISILRKHRGPNGEVGPLASTEKYRDAVKELENDVINNFKKKEDAAKQKETDDTALHTKLDNKAHTKIKMIVGYDKPKINTGMGKANPSDTSAAFTDYIFNFYSTKKVELKKVYGDSPEGIQQASEQALTHAEAYAQSKGFITEGWKDGQETIMKAITSSSQQLDYLTKDGIGQAQLGTYARTGNLPAGVVLTEEDQKEAKKLGQYYEIQRLVNDYIDRTNSEENVKDISSRKNIESFSPTAINAAKEEKTSQENRKSATKEKTNNNDIPE